MQNSTTFDNTVFTTIMQASDTLWDAFAEEFPQEAASVDALLTTPYIGFHLKDYLMVPVTDHRVVTQRALLMMYRAMGPRLVNQLSALSESSRLDVVCGAMCMANDVAVLDQIAEAEKEMHRMSGPNGGEVIGLDMKTAIICAVCEWIAHEGYPSDPVQGIHAILNSIDLPMDMSNAILDTFMENLDEDETPPLAA